MHVIFAGVGEAIDESHPNTSLLVVAPSGGKSPQLLLDCGFTAAHAFYRFSPAPMDLEAVWISHFHGDHFLGLPLLLLRFWEEGRERPLTLVGQAGIRDHVEQAMNLAYPNFLSKIRYTLEFIDVSSGKPLSLAGFAWSFAETGHTCPCLALRLDHEKDALFYSSDGRPTDETLALARGAGLIVHEAFGLEPDTPGHGTVDRCLGFARKARARALALVHMNREVRRDHGMAIKKKLEKLEGLTAFLPEPGDRFHMQDLRLEPAVG